MIKKITNSYIFRIVMIIGIALLLMSEFNCGF